MTKFVEMGKNRTQQERTEYVHPGFAKYRTEPNPNPNVKSAQEPERNPAVKVVL